MLSKAISSEDGPWISRKPSQAGEIPARHIAGGFAAFDEGTTLTKVSAWTTGCAGLPNIFLILGSWGGKDHEHREDGDVLPRTRVSRSSLPQPIHSRGRGDRPARSPRPADRLPDRQAIAWIGSWRGDLRCDAECEGKRRAPRARRYRRTHAQQGKPCARAAEDRQGDQEQD